MINLKYGNDFLLCYEDKNKKIIPFFRQKDLIINTTPIFAEFEQLDIKKKIGEEVKITTAFAIEKNKIDILNNKFKRKNSIDLYLKDIEENKVQKLGRFVITELSYLMSMDEYFKIDISFEKENKYE